MSIVTCKVELIAGKTVPVDEGNRYFFAGKIEEETNQGWGFPRYNVSTLGPMAGRLMAVDPNAPKVRRFIPARRRTLSHPLQQPFAYCGLCP